MRFSDWSSDVCSSDLLLPFGAPAGDVVQTVLQPGGEIIGDIALEEPLKEGRHQPPFFLRDKAVLSEPHIGAVLQGLERRRIGRWTAAPEPLHLLDEAGLRIAESGRAACREGVWQYG